MKLVSTVRAAAAADHFNGVTSVGFPGFDGVSASVSLAYTAAVQEHGVPVTYSYMSSAHVDAHGNDPGPGQADYGPTAPTCGRPSCC